MEQELARLQKLVDQSRRIVFFGGAGVSTESGIPDFRSEDGLYRQHYPVSPEEMLHRSFFDSHPREFFSFYREKLLNLWAKPNRAHLALAKLEQAGKLHAVITQNIDGLHQQAGSKRVLELHGSVHRNYCMRCNKLYDTSFVAEQEGVPTCTCGGTVKPDVVLYGEQLDEQTMKDAVSELEQADLLIVAGTSLRVYPAAGLLRWYRGSNLVLINYDHTEMDELATVCLHYPVGEVLGELQI